MRPTFVLTLASALIAVALSGCIDPSDLEAQADEWKHEKEHESWAEEECEDDDTGASTGSSTGDTPEDEVEPEEAFDDAAPRYANEVDGDEDSRRTISVPLGTDSLRVGLVHDSDGDVTFLLRDPLFRTSAREEADGEKYLYEEDWAYIDDPIPGDWTLDIEIDGRSSYTIGFYIDD